MTLDLNCDLGEGEPLSRTRVLMRWITSANVACGGHAGNVRTMQACVRLAAQFGIRLGAHPGSATDFGRSTADVIPAQLDLLLLQQVGTLERFASDSGAKLHHIKLHGSLYHASETSDAFRRCYILAVKRWWPGVVIYALAGGRVAHLAKRSGVQCWEEAFADRGYRDDGSLVPRDQPGALVKDVDTAAARVRLLLRQGALESTSGRRVRVRAQTLCVHSDTPNSVRLVRVLARMLGCSRE